MHALSENRTRAPWLATMDSNHAKHYVVVFYLGNGYKNPNLFGEEEFRSPYLNIANVALFRLSYIPKIVLSHFRTYISIKIIIKIYNLI